MRQMAYARGVLGAEGNTKKQIALNVGYSPAVANSVVSHIESTAGFNNAMAKLAVESNNLALAALCEFKSRGFREFSNKELTNALTAIGGAWEKFNAPIREKSSNDSGNKLRNIVLQQIENQNITNSPEKVINQEAEKQMEKPYEAEVMDVEDPMDF